MVGRVPISGVRFRPLQSHMTRQITTIIVSELLPLKRLIMRTKAMNIIQRCFAREIQGNDVTDSWNCPGLGMEKSLITLVHQLGVLSIAFALGYCLSPLLLCLYPISCLCPDYCPEMLLCFPFILELALGNDVRA